MRVCDQDIKLSFINWLSDHLYCKGIVLVAQELTHSKKNYENSEDEDVEIGYTTRDKIRNEDI